MWLVLCEASDASALWAYRGLRERGLAPLELVTADMLGVGVRWEHRLGARGVSTEITLGPDCTICSDTIRGVLNRLVRLPPAWLHRARASDRDYAGQELAAFFLSWLYALPQPTLNRPTPQGLSGSWRSVSEWVWLASRAGLPSPTYRWSSRDQVDESGETESMASDSKRAGTVIVVEQRVVGAAAPPEILHGCRRLANLAGTPLLGVEFAHGAAGPWTFAGATPLPELRLGEQAVLDALAAVLRDGGATEE